MTDRQAWVASTYLGLADLLAAAPAQSWDAPSLCQSWNVRHVVAHVSMPARFTPEEFGAKMAAAGGSFDAVSIMIAIHDAGAPVATQLSHLRSPVLHAWQPPGGGVEGALSHAVIHSLDITIALDQPTVAPPPACQVVLDQLTAANGALFGLDLSATRLEATDTGWGWGTGQITSADTGQLVALLSGRTLPDGRALPRR